MYLFASYFNICLVYIYFSFSQCICCFSVWHLEAKIQFVLFGRRLSVQCLLLVYLWELLICWWFLCCCLYAPEQLVLLKKTSSKVGRTWLRLILSIIQSNFARQEKDDGFEQSKVQSHLKKHFLEFAGSFYVKSGNISGKKEKIVYFFLTFNAYPKNY